MSVPIPPIERSVLDVPCTHVAPNTERCGALVGNPCMGPDLRPCPAHPERIAAARLHYGIADLPVLRMPFTDAQREEVLAAAELRAWAESLAPGSWVGVDFDRTLCTYDGEWREGRIVGDPIAPMVERVRRWLAAGVDVRIFTARANQEDQHAQIEAWCLAHLGRFLPVTATKDWRMVEAWDDAMVSVERNTGRRLAPSRIPGEKTPDDVGTVPLTDAAGNVIGRAYPHAVERMVTCNGGISIGGDIVKPGAITIAGPTSEPDHQHPQAEAGFVRNVEPAR